jgi:hypothetical protein
MTLACKVAGAAARLQPSSPCGSIPVRASKLVEKQLEIAHGVLNSVYKSSCKSRWYFLANYICRYSTMDSATPSYGVSLGSIPSSGAYMHTPFVY